MRTIEGQAGEHISKVAERCVQAVAAGEDVEVKFNDAVFAVTTGMTAGDVVAEYHRISEERHAAYVATPEFKAAQRRREEEDRQRHRDREAALVAAPPSMTLKNAEGWATARAVNTDGYGNAVMEYAERWARIMEGMIAGGAKLSDVADRASSLADVEGITGFMYGAAVSTLAHVWVHGEELRRWHNLATQVRDEGEKANESGGVLNPAVLTIGGAR